MTRQKSLSKKSDLATAPQKSAGSVTKQRRKSFQSPGANSGTSSNKRKLNIEINVPPKKSPQNNNAPMQTGQKSNQTGRTGGGPKHILKHSATGLSNNTKVNGEKIAPANSNKRLSFAEPERVDAEAFAAEPSLKNILSRVSRSNSSSSDSFDNSEEVKPP